MKGTNPAAVLLRSLPESKAPKDHNNKLPA